MSTRPRAPATIEDVIGSVALWQGHSVKATPLPGGLTNSNFVVEVDQCKYVVRIPGEVTELLAVDRHNELHNTRVAAAVGVGPKVVEYVPHLQAMVLEFIEAKTMSGTSLQSPAMVRQMAETIRQMHQGPRFLHDFNMFRLVEYYLEVVAELNAPLPSHYLDRLDQVGQIERALALQPLALVPCHNDLLAENYLYDGRRLWIVDYEYSGNNDPCFELGNTAQECAFGDELREMLCEAYFGRTDPRLSARMNLQAVMSDVGWTLWAAIQAKISRIEYDYWGWAVERWERATLAFESGLCASWTAQLTAD